MAQSCLEIVSMNARHEQIVRSDYTAEDVYSAQHPDAIAGDDEQGKGTQSGGMRHWLPDCSSYNGTSQFRYDDFDTGTTAGNKTDRESRKTALVRSKYSDENPYSATMVDTAANVREGQVVVY